MQPDHPRILFLFSDTGGGHRSAAEAIIEALHLEFSDQISTEMVDVFKDYAPRPFNKLPDLYPKLARMPHAWGVGYLLSNGYRRMRAANAGLLPYVRRSINTLVAQHPCEMIVSVHPLINDAFLHASSANRPYFVTVVTDLVTTHALWYSRKVDLCLVPTQDAYRRASKAGLRPWQVQVVGLPVAERFCAPPGDRNALRQRFGWPVDRKIILLVGGGEGMGPLEKTAHAIAQSCPSAALIVIAARNAALKKRLESTRWPIPTFIYGFVREMPDFMRAVDILVTKAGPGTICEALIAGLPMILYSRLPGQEDGNVTYIVTEGAGVWAPRPEKISAALKDWLENPEAYSQAVAACQRLARPQAARQIAGILAKKLSTIPHFQKNYA